MSGTLEQRAREFAKESPATTYMWEDLRDFARLMLQEAAEIVSKRPLGKMSRIEIITEINKLAE